MSIRPVTNLAVVPGSQFDCDELVVHDLDDEGRGVARVGEKIISIDGALVGETVRVQRRRRRRGTHQADLIEVLQASPDRAVPGCDHYELCGGCQLQHLSVSAQRARKSALLADVLALHSVPLPGFHREPIFGGAKAYRRKARLGVRYVPGKGGALVGFREKRRNFVAELEACAVLVPALGQRVAALRGLISRLDARARIPQIEVAAGENAAAFVVRHLDTLTKSDQTALTDFAVQHDVHLYLQPAGPDSVAPLHPRWPSPLTYTLPEFSLELAFKPTDFVQVNAEVNRKLVEHAVRLLDLRPKDRVLDLYCGIGNFSLAIARRARHVAGVEYGADMVQTAQSNAKKNNVINVRFSQRDLQQPDAVASCLAERPDKLLLDPPRSGAGPVVSALEAPYPSRIVYVSCNPQTFARDAAVLVSDHGYRFEAAGIVDMFPHTNHVEVIGAFTRRSS